MPRLKERRKIIHSPSTHEIITCICIMPDYAKILFSEGPEKPYKLFLQWLIENNFYASYQEKLTIKKIASDFKSDTIKITKWMREIYYDVFELNFENPALFQKSDTKVCFYLKHYDDRCTFHISIHALPRVFETVRFPFVMAKLGIDHFWVESVNHQICESEPEITIWLKGGTVNKYRAFALDKALFHGWIHFMDVYYKHDFELDKELKQLFRN